MRNVGNSIRGSEFAGLRQGIISRASGETLEIGAGKGANFDVLPHEVNWAGVEPDHRKWRQLARRAERAGHHPRVLRTGAERIPLPDESLDTVLGTFVLCSVDDVDVVLQEMHRLLVPGGRLLLIDHVWALPGSRARLFQERLTPWSVRFMKGCRLDRDIPAHLAASQFSRVSAKQLNVAAWPLPDMPAFFFEGQKESA